MVALISLPGTLRSPVLSCTADLVALTAAGEAGKDYYHLQGAGEKGVTCLRSQLAVCLLLLDLKCCQVWPLRSGLKTTKQGPTTLHLPPPFGVALKNGKAGLSFPLFRMKGRGWPGGRL